MTNQLTLDETGQGEDLRTYSLVVNALSNRPPRNGVSRLRPPKEVLMAFVSMTQDPPRHPAT